MPARPATGVPRLLRRLSGAGFPVFPGFGQLIAAQLDQLRIAGAQCFTEQGFATLHRRLTCSYSTARVQRDRALALLGQGLQLGIELGLLQLVALQACLLQLLAQRPALCMALRVGLRAAASSGLTTAQAVSRAMGRCRKDMPRLHSCYPASIDRRVRAKVPQVPGTPTARSRSRSARLRRAEERLQLFRPRRTDSRFGLPLRRVACGERVPVRCGRQLLGRQAERLQPLRQRPLPGSGEARGELVGARLANAGHLLECGGIQFQPRAGRVAGRPPAMPASCRRRRPRAPRLPPSQTRRARNCWSQPGAGRQQLSG